VETISIIPPPTHLLFHSAERNAKRHCRSGSAQQQQQHFQYTLSSHAPLIYFFTPPFSLHNPKYLFSVTKQKRGIFRVMKFIITVARARQ
jgi:hypothetical protein